MLELWTEIFHLLHLLYALLFKLLYFYVIIWRMWKLCFLFIHPNNEKVWFCTAVASVCHALSLFTSSCQPGLIFTLISSHKHKHTLTHTPPLLYQTMVGDLTQFPGQSQAPLHSWPSASHHYSCAFFNYCKWWMLYSTDEEKEEKIFILTYS